MELHRPTFHSRTRFALAAACAVVSLGAAPALAQPAGPPATQQATAAPDPAVGRPVAEVRVVGNRTVPEGVILNTIRTAPGEPFDPVTVREDYQRIYGLRRFTRVDARYQETPQGVVVVFTVVENDTANRISFEGNSVFTDETLRETVTFEAGDALDAFSLALARQAIERLYRERNYSFAEVQTRVDEENDTVVFEIIEGPRVRVRNIDFVGATRFSEGRLKDVIETGTWFPITWFGQGIYDPEQIEDDVAALVKFYRDEGFFDVRVGRKIILSPDQTEVQIDFLIDEGPQYVIDEIRFEGNEALSDEVLREAVRLEEGQTFEDEAVQREIRRIVRAYSPLGFIYDPNPFSSDPEYLQIQARPVYSMEPGKATLVFSIREGKPFETGQIIVRGNSKTQEKVILRQMDLAPGELYDSDAVQTGVRRLQGTGFFSRVSVSTIGEDPESRDLLIEVEEAPTATFIIGGGINSNGGLSGEVTYRQRNFDIADWPESSGDFLRGDAFVGAGQRFEATFQPGTITTNASISFFEPYIFDQNYGFGTEGYWRTTRRDEYRVRRGGGQLSLTKRFTREWSSRLTLRGEDVNLYDIEDPEEDRAPEILAAEGHDTLTSVGLQVRRSTITNPILPRDGTQLTVAWESFGALGGDLYFQRITAGADWHVPLYVDLLDRPTVLQLSVSSGFLYEDAPVYERFYAGGLGTVRGFGFRGISPRSGPDDDPVGGDFTFSGTAQVGFPIYQELLRGVVFSDFGTVEEDLTVGTIRTSAGFGVRLALPAFGNVPIAVDVAWPLNRYDEDETRVISFALGLTQ